MPESILEKSDTNFLNWKIAFLGTFHPAEETFLRLSKLRWVKLLVLPKSAGFRNDNLLTIAREYDVPWTYEISDLECQDIDLLLAANYPEIVPLKYLRRWPCLNTHWSALPKYRGMHSTAWALLNEDYLPAITVHWMEESFDTGPILAQEYVPVRPQTTIYQLHEDLANKQADAVIHLLHEYKQTGTWPSVPQLQNQATYVSRRRPDDGIIDWNWPTEKLWNLVRVLQKPLYPGAFTFHGTRKLIIWDARPADCPAYFATCGQIVRVLDDGSVWIKTGDTCLEVSEVQWIDEPESGSPATRLLRGGGDPWCPSSARYPRADGNCRSYRSRAGRHQGRTFCGAV